MRSVFGRQGSYTSMTHHISLAIQLALPPWRLLLHDRLPSFWNCPWSIFIEISEIFDLVNLEIFQSGRPSRKNWFWETTPANHNYPDFFTHYCLLNHFSAFRRVFRTIKYLQPLGASLRLVKIMRKHFMHFLFKSCSADSKAKRQWTSSY